jgi:flagellar hook-basal body complex protein FliE
MAPLSPSLLPALSATPTSGASLEFPTLPTRAARPGGADGEGFSALLDRMVREARGRDVVAQEAVESFARGDDPGRIHEVMVAATKAEIALRTMTSVRNKLLEAYRDLQHVTM